MKRFVIAALLTGGLITTAASAAPTSPAIVVCAPGQPGSTEEAQPTMDVLAKAVSSKSGGAFTAIYDPNDSAGAKRLAESGLGIVTLPFYLEHVRELGLHARLVAVQKGRPALDRWAVVVKKGRAADPSGLKSFTITSAVAFAPGFIRGVVLGGKAISDVKLKQSTAVLSALRHAADGDPVAVVIDGATEASLATLPFGKDLEIIWHSPSLPAAVIVTIDKKLDDKAWAPLEKAFLALANDAAGAAALDAVRMATFVALDDPKALAAAVDAYAKAPQP